MTLREETVGAYISEHYPNAEIVNYNDEGSGLRFYTAEELGEVDGDWFPLSCHKDGNGRVLYGGRGRVYHTYTEGETGAGKTTRFVMQSIRALSSMKTKPSFVIVDIHGEIIENLYPHLRKNGYAVRILNCDDPERSDTYNPLRIAAEEALRERRIGDGALQRIRRISEIIQPIESRNDPIWERGARAYTNGCILDKFEDLIAGELPIEAMTLYNVIQNHYNLRETIGSGDLFDVPHYRKKGSRALSVQKMISVTNNAERTRASYWGVVENRFDDYGQPSLYSLSSSSTLSIRDFLAEPTAIVIQSGSTKIGDALISLLVNEIYTEVVKLGKASATKRLPRNVHCFLDEFANCNVAEGEEYVKMLTTSRKFGMFWHMILQCDAQLDRKFDKELGRIIRANSTEIFMGSHDYETAVRFARSCGQKTVESLGTMLSRSAPQLTTVDLMTADRLNLTEEGYAYVKSDRCPVLRTYIEALYNCEEHTPAASMDEVYPHNDFDYRATTFFPSDIPSAVSKAAYDLLTFLGDKRVSYRTLKEAFPSTDLTKLLRTLSEEDMVTLLPGARVECGLSPMQRSILRCCEETVEEESEIESDPFTFSSPKRFPTRRSEREAWFKALDADENGYVSALSEHLSALPGLAALRPIEHLTSVPEVLLNASRAYLEGDRRALTGKELAAALSSLEFDIVETFVRAHDYRSKSLWVRKLREELAELERSGVFPDVILEDFRKAERMIGEDLSIANLMEIRKILRGGEDGETA